MLAASAGLCVAVSACYTLQPDWLAPVTLVPAWCWLLPALVLTVGGMRRYGQRGQRIAPSPRRFSLALRASVVALWIAYAVFFVEESRSLLRFGRGPTAAWQAAREHGRALRVVSLNCHGDARAAEEVAAWEPDIVLLQESPGREAVQRLAQELFGTEGACLPGSDTSILARGKLLPRAFDPNAPFVHGTVTHPSGLSVEVVSLRLCGPVFRLDFWMPGFWIDHHDCRVRHRQEVLSIVEHLRTTPLGSPLIVGGDCNAPPGDGALAPLRERLHETFRAAGRGWGATGTNQFPLFRVDQIWVSPEFCPERVMARKTVHSDHRMVVCEVIIE